MKYLLILSTLLFSFTAKSQCCPYINSIEVIPASPSTADSIKIVTSVTTPNQGMFIYSSYSINGNTIDVEACYYSGLLTATQTYFDTLEIGVLAGGNYTIDFTAYQAADTICNYTDSMTATYNFDVLPTGNVPTIDQQTVQIYPNPSNGIFTIELSDHVNATHTRIHSISGKVVHSGIFQEEMNLDLNVGSYYLELLENGLTVGYQRLLIE